MEEDDCTEEELLLEAENLCRDYLGRSFREARIVIDNDFRLSGTLLASKLKRICFLLGKDFHDYSW